MADFISALFTLNPQCTTPQCATISCNIPRKCARNFFSCTMQTSPKAVNVYCNIHLSTQCLNHCTKHSEAPKSGSQPRLFCHFRVKQLLCVKNGQPVPISDNWDQYTAGIWTKMTCSKSRLVPISVLYCNRIKRVERNETFSIFQLG